MAGAACVPVSGVARLPEAVLGLLSRGAGEGVTTSHQPGRDDWAGQASPGCVGRGTGTQGGRSGSGADPLSDDGFRLAGWEGPPRSGPLSRVTDPAPTPAQPNCGESPSPRGVLGTVPPDSLGGWPRGESPPLERVFPLWVSLWPQRAMGGGLHGGASLRDRGLVSHGQSTYAGALHTLSPSSPA